MSLRRKHRTPILRRDRKGVFHGPAGPPKAMKTPPWRGLSVCCAENRLGVGPDIATRRLQPSRCLPGSGLRLVREWVRVS
jgi:hypothetical protein